MRPGQTVLDPFCGSGTTLVQANELGCTPAGIDVSAFNVLLARAKTAIYEPAPPAPRGGGRPPPRRSGPPPERRAPGGHPCPGAARRADGADTYLRHWYAPPAPGTSCWPTAPPSPAARSATPTCLRVILSRAARSARLTTHFELDFPRAPQREPYWCHKHRRECRPAHGRPALPAPLQRRHPAPGGGLRRRAHGSAGGGDTTPTAAAPLFPAAHGIITSPPYVGLIDYHAQHAYAYHLLGLTSLRAQEIGAPGAGTGRAARRRYQEDVALVLRRAATGLPAGAPVLVVAADRHDLYPEIAGLAGLEPVDVLQRQVNRRTGRRARGLLRVRLRLAQALTPDRRSALTQAPAAVAPAAATKRSPASGA